MNTFSGRKRPQTILLVLLVLAILLDRTLIAGLFPWMQGLAGVNPIIVLFDIPVQLPVIFDLPVTGIFFLFYWILLLSYPTQYGAGSWAEIQKRTWRIFTGALVILLCLAVGGGIYYFSSGLMSREVRNGIDSFGIQADIYTPIPDHELIHLRGGMILLVCLLIGVRIFIKRTALGLTERVAVSEQGQEVTGVIGAVVDPSLTGFQEKRRLAGEREIGKRGGSVEREVVAKAEIAVLPPRVRATPVPVVAPMPVEVH